MIQEQKPITIEITIMTIKYIAYLLLCVFLQTNTTFSSYSAAKSDLDVQNFIDQVFAGVSIQPKKISESLERLMICLLYTSPSPRDRTRSRMPSSA